MTPHSFVCLLFTILSTTRSRVLGEHDNDVAYYSRDNGYYPGRQISPVEASFPQYYSTAAALLQDLDKFEGIYIQYHSCQWTDLLSSSNDEDANDVDENDYWYQGVNPAGTAAAAISVYGVLPDPRTRKWKLPWPQGCQRKTFLNSFVVDPQYLMLNSNDMNNVDDGEQQYSSCANNDNNEQPFGLGCTASGEFAYFEYSLNWQNEPVCDANHILSVVDALDDWNSALRNEDNDCLEVTYETAQSLLAYAATCSFEDPACPDPVGVLKSYRNAARTPHSKTANIVRGVAWGLVAIFGVYVALVLLDECRLACKPNKPKNGNLISQRNFRGNRDDETTSSLSDESSFQESAKQDAAKGGMANISRLFSRKRSSSQSVHQGTLTSRSSPRPRVPGRVVFVPGGDGKVPESLISLQPKGVSDRALSQKSVDSKNGNKRESAAHSQRTNSSANLVPPSSIAPRSAETGSLKSQQQSHDEKGLNLSDRLFRWVMNGSSTQSKSSPNGGESAAHSGSDWLLAGLGIKPKSSLFCNNPAIPPAQPVSIHELKYTRTRKRVAELPRIDEDGESTESFGINSCTSESFIQVPPHSETCMEPLPKNPKTKRRWGIFPRLASKVAEVAPERRSSGGSTCKSVSTRSVKIVGFPTNPKSSTDETSYALAEAARLVSVRSTSTKSSQSSCSNSFNIQTNEVVRSPYYDSVEPFTSDHTSASEKSADTDIVDMSGSHPFDEDPSEDETSTQPSSSIICCKDDFFPKQREVGGAESLAEGFLSSITAKSVRDRCLQEGCDQSSFGENIESVATSRLTIGDESRKQPVDAIGNDTVQNTGKNSVLVAEPRCDHHLATKIKFQQKAPLTVGLLDKKETLWGTGRPSSRNVDEQTCKEAYEVVASKAMIRNIEGGRPSSARTSPQTKARGEHLFTSNRKPRSSDNKALPKQVMSSRMPDAKNSQGRKQVIHLTEATTMPMPRTSESNALSHDIELSATEDLEGNLPKKTVPMISTAVDPKPIGIREYLTRRLQDDGLEPSSRIYS